MYPSNLTDKQWQIVETFLPTHRGGFKILHNKRQLIDAVLYVNKTGCQWRYLPKDFPPWPAVYSYFWRLSAKGIFEKINAELRKMVRVQEGRDPSPSLLCIDSQSVSGEVNLDDKGIDGYKKVKGRKRHIMTDVLGLIFYCTVTAANVADIHPAQDFLYQLKENHRLKKVLADSAYQGIAGDHGNFSLEISSKKPEQQGFVPIHKRWVVERTFAWLKRQRRLCRDYEYDSENQRSMIFIGMMGLMARRLA